MQNEYCFERLSSEQNKTLLNSEQAYNAYLSMFKKFRESYRFAYYSQNGKRFYKYDPNLKKKFYLKCDAQEFLKIKNEYDRSKNEIAEKLSVMAKNIEAREKYNKFERLNNAPELLIDICRKINEYGLDKKLIIIGTNSLYAYENLFGFRFVSNYLATEDIDLYNRRQTKIKLALFEKDKIADFNDFLRSIDRSFEQDPKLPYAFINKENAIVEVINPFSSNIKIRAEKEYPFFDKVLCKLSINGSHWIDNSRTVTSTIIDYSGRMANITAIHPLEFAIYKNWLSKQPDRNFKKIDRDKQVSQAIVSVLKEFYPRDLFDECQTLLHLKKDIVIDFIKDNGLSPNSKAFLNMFKKSNDDVNEIVFDE